MTTPILRLESALAGLGATYEPPWGWQTRVLAAVEAPRRRRGWWWLTLPATAALALVLVRPPTAEPLALRMAVVPVGPEQRGGAAHVGDRVHAEAAGGDRYRALWVYRDHRELVVACPGGPSCGDLGDTTAVEVTLSTLGAYELIALTSASPIPAPHGTYDADLAAADHAGAKTQRDHLTVR